MGFNSGFKVLRGLNAYVRASRVRELTALPGRELLQRRADRSKRLFKRAECVLRSKHNASTYTR